MTTLKSYLPSSTMTDGICCKLQAVVSPCTICPPSSYQRPTTTVNKMHSRRGRTTGQLCFPQVSQDQPTDPLKLFIYICLLFCFVSSLFSFAFCLFLSIASFVLSFFRCFPPTPCLLLAVEVNHHLYYTALQLINNMPGRKKNNPHLLSSLSLSLSVSHSLFLSLAKSQNKRAKNSELPRNPIWTPPLRLHGQLSQPALE